MTVLPQSGSLTLLRPSKKSGYTELIADPSSSAVQFGGFAIRSKKANCSVEGLLGYRRSLEFDETNGSGQDFAVLRGDDQYTVGVLSDGVSQSFYGEVAATQVSRHLVGYLWSVRLAPPCKDAVERELKRLESEVAKIVSRWAIPEAVPPMVQVALEKKKPSGSQAVFAAFLLDNLEQNLHVYLCGDVRVAVCSAGRQPLSLQADPNGRWSSAGASDLRLKCESHSKVEAVVLASDGVDDDWNRQLFVDTNSSLQSSFRAMAQEQATKDDVSFVFVHFLRGAQAVQRETYAQTEAQEVSVTWVDGVNTERPPRSSKPEIENAHAQSSPSRRPGEREKSSRDAVGLDRKSWATVRAGGLLLAIFGLGLLAGIAFWSWVSGGTNAVSRKGPGPARPTAPPDVSFSVVNDFEVIRDLIDDVSPPVGAATIEFISDLPNLRARLSYVASGNRQSNVEVGPFEPHDRRYFAFCKMADVPKTGTAVTITILDSADRDVKTLTESVEEGHVYKVSVKTANK